MNCLHVSQVNKCEAYFLPHSASELIREEENIDNTDYAATDAARDVETNFSPNNNEPDQNQAYVHTDAAVQIKAAGGVEEEIEGYYLLLT